jgi:hypothetical protein
MEQASTSKATLSSKPLPVLHCFFLNDARIPASEYISTIRGHGKSIEHTLYPPAIERRRFMRAHNDPIYFVKYPTDVVPTYRLVKEFTYELPAYLPRVRISAVNPDIKIYERVP